MKSSSFKEVIRLQFNALMMITIKGTLKQKRKLLARHFKQEVLFCEMGEAKLNEQRTAERDSGHNRGNSSDFDKKIRTGAFYSS